MPRFNIVWAVPLTLLYLLEVLSQLMRIVSLSIRLYANMLAGHMLILALLGLIFAISSVVIGITVIPLIILLTTLIYAFEICIVVGIQAFIFAILSANYIGSAIEPEH